jgi:hypothetical protein
VTARAAIAALAGLALLAIVSVGPGASRASTPPRDGRPSTAAPSVHNLDGHRSTAAPSVHNLDGHRSTAAPSVDTLDGRPRAAATSVPSPDPRPHAAPQPVRLTIVFVRRPGSRHVAHVRCTAMGARADGYLRRVGAARACAHARRIAGLLAGHPDPHRACSQIYGGPERALVTGTIGGRRIRHGFTRTNGCGVAEWRRAMPLLPRPG